MSKMSLERHGPRRRSFAESFATLRKIEEMKGRKVDFFGKAGFLPQSHTPTVVLNNTQVMVLEQALPEVRTAYREKKKMSLARYADHIKLLVITARYQAKQRQALIAQNNFETGIIS